MKTSWLCLERFGIVKDVRKLIYKKLTSLERVTVEVAHGVKVSLEKKKYTICISAVKRRYFEVLKWAYQNGGVVFPDIIGWAANEGNLEMVKWLYANDCPWDREACASAAINGHLEVLKFLREHRCPWDKERCLELAFFYPDVVEWIKQTPF